jgi:hypothetical protein
MESNGDARGFPKDNLNLEPRTKGSVVQREKMTYGSITSHSVLSEGAKLLWKHVEHRLCCFCHQPEEVAVGVGRLLYIGGSDSATIGVGKWSHSGCLYWCCPGSETFLDQKEVLNTIEKSEDKKCLLCRKPNANLMCCVGNCRHAYHWPCVAQALFESSTVDSSPKIVRPRKVETAVSSELKKLQKIHLECTKKQLRCAQHVAGSVASGGKPQLPSFAECEYISQARITLSHPQSVPLYVSSLPTESPGQLLTQIPPYDPVCLVAGGAALTHIGRIPYEDPQFLIEQRNPPLLIPVGFTVLRRFWSYKNTGELTYITISRLISTKPNLSSSQSTNSSSTSISTSCEDALTNGKQLNAEEDLYEEKDHFHQNAGIVVEGEETPDDVVIDQFKVDKQAAKHIRWTVKVHDDPDGDFDVKSINDIMPILLGRFENPYPIAVNHHYLSRPESLVLLHHPVVLRFVENLPHAAQCTSYPFRYVDRITISKTRDSEKALRRGSSRTDPISGSHVSTRHGESATGLLALTPGSPGKKSTPLLHVHAHPPASTPPSGNTSIPSSLASSPNVATRTSNGPSRDPEPSSHVQYLKMKEMEKQHVFIRPSRIQGVGLFAGRTFSIHDMVIEYLGEVVGQKVADTREVVNDREGIGTYFFAIEHDRILDATRKGNAARFINHSCEPNCYARIIAPLDGVKRVVIFASRRIDINEELYV